MSLIEVLGYLASVLIAVAMMMKGMLRLRVVALLGSLAMALYGGLIDAWPIVIANLFISAVHAYYLRGLLSRSACFELQPIAKASHWYLDRFLRFYAEDIARWYPDFTIDPIPERRGFFILRDMLSAGLFLYTEEGDDLRIHLDYVTPAYRDLKNAHFAYAEFARSLNATGAGRFLVTPATTVGKLYFLRLGFRPTAADPAIFERPIAQDAAPALPAGARPAGEPE